MANDAFALSPMTARAAQPDDADYEAIREAFMETARGRWFLGEYSKRNRNADTSMVLDQVARIEQMLEALPHETPDTRLTETLTSIRNVVDQATELAASAANRLAIDDRLAPIRRGARILKGISWRWREIGADSRLCDSIDAQVAAIEKSCSQLARVDTRAALTAAFELLRTRIEALAEEHGVSVTPAGNPAATFSAATQVRVAAEDDTPGCAKMLAPEPAISIQEPYEAAVVAMRPEATGVREQALLGIPPIELANFAGRGDSRADAADHGRVASRYSEVTAVAAQIAPAASQDGRCSEPAATTPGRLPADPPWLPHSSLGSAPFFDEMPESHRPADTDPAGVIRRMSLTEKIAFFA